MFYSYGCKEDNPQLGRKPWVADFFHPQGTPFLRFSVLLHPFFGERVGSRIIG
jgi:hypothetical protein